MSDSSYLEGKSSEKLAVARQAASIGIFTATAVVCGYLLIMVPNVELMTVMISLAGIYLGVYGGALVGIFAVTIFNGLNTWGLPYPPVWLAQMTGMGLNGLLFGFLRGKIFSSRYTGKVAISLTAGVLITLFYDFLTTVAFPVSTGIAPGKGWIPFLIAGLPFMLIHVISNGVIFTVLLPAVVTRLKFKGLTG
ncbi:hypothetical protein ACFLQJ_02085 [Calditrichota bacterium]